MGILRFYRDEPLFGLDIGHASLKAMQVDSRNGRNYKVLGYGTSSFATEAIDGGVIVRPEVVAAAVHKLFEEKLVGSINSRRVACAIPTTHTFSHPMKLPPMKDEDILEAVHLEAEQYIPMPLGNLYLDYEISDRDEHGIELLVVAAPKRIIDSYRSLLESLSLEPIVFEPSINAASRFLRMNGQDRPSIVVDIGSTTTDIAIFDKTLLVSSTVNSGGGTMINLISKKLQLSREHAARFKDEYGISYSEHQQQIVDAIRPILDTLTHEIQKTIRYYSERAAKSGRRISQVITVGGGSVMPGFNQYLNRELRLPTQNLNPWQKLDLGNLPSPSKPDASIYTTAAGEAVLNPKEIVR